jgi:predicted hydrocarbon binding protein
MEKEIISFKEKKFNQICYENFLKIKQSYQLSHKELSQILNLSESKIQKILNKEEPLDILHLVKLASVLKLNLDRIFNDKFNTSSLQNENHYLLGAYSNKNSAIKILKQISKMKGLIFTQYILDYLNVSGLIFNESVSHINILFFEDLFNLLNKFGFKKNHYELLGRKSLYEENLEVSPYIKEKLKSNNLKNLWEKYFLDFIHFIEKNNIYKIKSLNDEKCVVMSLENQDLLDIFNKSSVGTIERCHYRVGALSEVTYALGFERSFVFETKCVHQGDSHCEFEIYFNNEEHHHGIIHQQSKQYS